jgi:hypothetical protein
MLTSVPTSATICRNTGRSVSRKRHESPAESWQTWLSFRHHGKSATCAWCALHQHEQQPSSGADTGAVLTYTCSLRYAHLHGTCTPGISPMTVAEWLQHAWSNRRGVSYARLTQAFYFSLVAAAQPEQVSAAYQLSVSVHRKQFVKAPATPAPYQMHA